MTRKPLNQSEFLSALDFVRTDIDNLRAYFEQGVIAPTSAVVERALKMRVSIEMFVALFGSATARDGGISEMFDELTAQNKAIARQNAEILQQMQSSGVSQNNAILNEILNVKEMLSKSGEGKNEISEMKEYLNASLCDLQDKITKNLQETQKTQLQDYSSHIISEVNYSAKRSGSGAISGELLGEIAEMREELNKKLNLMEQNITESIAVAKDEVIYSQKTEESIQIAKESKVDIEKSIVFAKTNMHVLRAISKQLMGMYQAEKRALADIEKNLAGKITQSNVGNVDDAEISQGFAELKEELRGISNIINFGDSVNIATETNQAIEEADNSDYADFEPEGLLETAKELENLAKELAEMEANQSNT